MLAQGLSILLTHGQHRLVPIDQPPCYAHTESTSQSAEIAKRA
jgi:hypothetical protein